MGKRVQVITVPRDATMPAENITGPEWTAAQSQIANASSLAELADTRVFDIRKYGNIGTPDDSATFQAAMDAASAAGGATVTMPTGTYALQQPINLGNAVLELNGSTLDFSTATLPNYAELIVSRGSATPLPAMSGPIQKHANEITFASEHGLQVGDWIIAYNTSDFSFASIRSYYRDGQFFQVADVTSTTTIVTRGRASTFLPSGCVMSKMDPARGTVRNGVVQGRRGTPYQAVVLDYTAGSEVADMTMIDTERAMTIVRRSVDFRVSNVQGNNRIPESVGNFYGVMLANCQSGYVEGCRVVSRRSAFSIGGYDEENSIPNRFIRVRGNQFTTVGTHASMGFHGNSEYIVYEGNTVEGAILLGGDHVTIRNNDIYTYRSQAISGSSEMVGFDHTIDGNNIYIRGEWTGFTDAPVLVDAGAVGSGSQSPTIGSVTRDGGTLRFTNNNIYIEGQEITANMSAVYIRKLPTCSASALCVDVSNNTFTAGIIAGNTLYSLNAVGIRCNDGTAFYNIKVESNDFQNLPLYFWGGHAKTMSISRNSWLGSKKYCFQVNVNGSPYFSDSVMEVLDNRCFNSGAASFRITSHAGETILIGRNTIMNPNRWDNTTLEGSAIYVNGASTVVLHDNTYGDTGGTTKMTRYITATNIGLLVDKDNTRLGSALGADAYSSVATRRFDGDVTGTPEGAVFASPGSIARSDNGSIYRKQSGTGNTGWTEM